jgi:hypothetical protein
VISGLALFIGKLWVCTVAGISGYYYLQGQYDDKVRTPGPLVQVPFPLALFLLGIHIVSVIHFVSYRPLAQLSHHAYADDGFHRAHGTDNGHRLHDIYHVHGRLPHGRGHRHYVLHHR